MMQSSAIIYGMVLIVAIFGGGFVIRLYGETCGLRILDPSSWLTVPVSVGSPSILNCDVFVVNSFLKLKNWCY